MKKVEAKTVRPWRCYLNGCGRPATHEVWWERYPVSPFKDRVCRDHAEAWRENPHLRPVLRLQRIGG